jgi:hypothetical protein
MTVSKAPVLAIAAFAAIVTLSVFAPTPQCKAAPAQEKDIRPEVRELIREALEVLANAKGGAATTERLAECALLQARMGDLKAARETLHKAKEIQLTGNQSRVAERMRQFAKICAATGETEELQEVLKALPDPGRNYRGTFEDFRATVMQECALELAKAGKGNDALDLIKDLKGELKPEAAKAWVLREIALYHARAGDLKEARKNLDLLPGAAHKVQTMAGSLYAGYQTLDLPSEPGIATIQEKSGDRDGARQTLKQAVELAREIDDADQKARLLAAIACGQAHLGDVADAQKTLEQIPKDSKSTLNALVAMARAQAAAGHGQAAQEIVEKLNSPNDKIYAYCEMADGHGSAGDAKAARAAGAQALELALTFAEPAQQRALHDVAFARASAKDYEGALETASKMTSPGFAYDNLAVFQARNGDVKGALRTLQDHKQQIAHYNGTLAGVASIQAEQGEEKEALSWVRKLTDSDSQCECLIGVAKGLLKRHKVGVSQR